MCMWLKQGGSTEVAARVDIVSCMNDAQGNQNPKKPAKGERGRKMSVTRGATGPFVSEAVKGTGNG